MQKYPYGRDHAFRIIQWLRKDFGLRCAIAWLHFMRQEADFLKGRN